MALRSTTAQHQAKPTPTLNTYHSCSQSNTERHFFPHSSVNLTKDLLTVTSEAPQQTAHQQAQINRLVSMFYHEGAARRCQPTNMQDKKEGKEIDYVEEQNLPKNYS